MIWSDRRRHHAIESEVQQSEVHEEQVPQELGCCPLKWSQTVEDCTVYEWLHKDVRELHSDLPKSNC
jgi:hypothetical protein